MTETKALTIPQPATPALLDGENFEKLVRAIKMMFDDTRGGISEKQALRLAATAMEEPGMGIMEAVNGGLHMIEGRPQLSARSLAKKIRLFGHDYEILEHTQDKCTIKGTRGDNGRVHTETYTMEDANHAGLVKGGSAWTKHPRNMLFAFCIRNLVTFHFPECRGSALLPGEAEAGLDVDPQEPPKVVTPEKKEESVDAEVVDDDDAALAAEIAQAATAESTDESTENSEETTDKTGMGAAEKGLLAEVKQMKAAQMQTFFENYEKELRGEKEWFDSVRDAFVEKWARFTKAGKLGIYPLIREEAEKKAETEEDDWDESQRGAWKNEPFFVEIAKLIEAEGGVPRGFHVSMSYVKQFVTELASSKKKDVVQFTQKIYDDNRVEEFFNWMMDSIEKADKYAKGEEVN